MVGLGSPANFSAIAARHSARVSYHNRGKTACANGVQLWMNEADDAVLEQLRDYILQPAIVEGAVADAVVLLRPAASELDAQRAELEQQARAIDGELANLARPSPPVANCRRSLP